MRNVRRSERFKAIMKTTNFPWMSSGYAENAITNYIRKEMNTNNKTALVTGALGQAGFFLIELLLDRGYFVVGTERSSSNPDHGGISDFLTNLNFKLEECDITIFSDITHILNKYKIDEFYNLAGATSVVESWNNPLTVFKVNFEGVLNCLEAIRLISPKTKFFQASTSEVYGEDAPSSPQYEMTEPLPQNPYAVSKLCADQAVELYRNSYDLFCCYARLYNFASYRQGERFVGRKITKAIGKMWNIVDQNIENVIPPNSFVSSQKAFEVCLDRKLIEPIPLGNLDSEKDFSHAEDIVKGIWEMMQRKTPEDYVLGYGSTRSIREFLDVAFSEVGVHDWSKFVIIDSDLCRPAHNRLCSDISKAMRDLNWFPHITFEKMVKEMVKYDISRS